jgi:hypothetical protein
MGGEPYNLRAGPRAASEAPALPDDGAACWNERELDLAALRRWFIRRVAAEAVRELKREDQHARGDS